MFDEPFIKYGTIILSIIFLLIAKFKIKDKVAKILIIIISICDLTFIITQNIIITAIITIIGTILIYKIKK